jgi:hypothetical protein
MKKKLLILMLLFFGYKGKSQKINIVTQNPQTSIRGLSVVNDTIVWASGSKGFVARSIDGGKIFKWMQIPNYTTRDFRDIEAFNADTAIIIAVGEPAIILKTIDGGLNWKKVFEDSTKGMFLDAMDFIDEEDGVVVGDPINNKIFMAITKDGGNTWITDEEKMNTKRPIVDSGEALFASSGSNVVMFYDDENDKYIYNIITGGKRSRLFFNDTIIELPLNQGKESTGANAIFFHNPGKAMIVGGDFANDTASQGNCTFVSFNNNKVKTYVPAKPPHGYKSSILYFNSKVLMACGTSGVDVSKDYGHTWLKFSAESFHVVKKAKVGSRIFLAGSKGRIARLD